MMTDTPISTRDGNTVDDMLREARERARDGGTFWRRIYKMAEEDIRFGDGDTQWPEEVKAERINDRRPCLTLNKLPQYLSQIKGDQRQNKPAINIIAVQDDKGLKFDNIAGTKDYSGAEVYEGLIRNIEYESNAEAHYDRAFDAGVDGGIGWLRVLAEYQADDVFDQALRIKRIANSFSVVLDPMASEPDWSDANWGFVFSKVSKKEFEKRYPGAVKGDLRDYITEGDREWWLADGEVVVAEYFTREPVNRELLKLSDGRVVWKDEVKDVLDELKDKGIIVQRSRKVTTYKVWWRKITAWTELESKREWPGQTIPVVPVLGKEVRIGDERKFNSAIHHAKDAQSAHNYWMTAATERVALAPKAPWKAPWKAIKNHLKFWNRANETNLPYLPYDETKSGAQPARELPPSIPAGEMQMAMAMTDEIKSGMGMYDASVGARGNATSGKQELLQQRESDTNSFEFVDNHSMAIRRIGKILVEAIPKIYDSERVIRIAFPDGEGDFVKINETIRDEESDKDVVIYDLGVGKYDVVVKTGPAYSTQRIEIAETLTKLVQAVPAMGNLIMDKLVNALDFPEAKEIAKRLKKALPQGVLEPQEIEELDIQPPQATPEQQAEMAKSEATIAKAEADKETAKAKAAEAQAKLREIEVIGSEGGLVEHVREIVADAMAELIQQLGQQSQPPNPTQ